jgi:hypothetical protein
VLLAEHEVALQRARVAVRAVLDRHALDHPVPPRPGVVLRAPDLLRLLGRIAAEDRVEEGVDGDVLHLLQVALELLAVAAVRIGEDDELALAGALLPDDRVLQRQVLPFDRGQLGDALLGQVDARLRVDELALDEVGAVLVAVDDVGADAELPDAGDRGLRDLVDLREVGQTLGDVLADRRFVGERRRGQAGGEEDGGERAQGVLHHAAVRSRALAR